MKPIRAVWAADPAGATEINELRAADIKVWKGNNDIKAGIAAVAARIRTGRLKVLRSKCPNLIGESELYRYPDKKEFQADSEKPIDDHNHALGGLRYLVSRLDERFMARFRQSLVVSRSSSEDFQQSQTDPPLTTNDEPPPENPTGGSI